jgi:hypothetical protein
MYSEQKTSDSAARFEVPAGHEVVFEPVAGVAQFPLTVYPDGDESRQVVIRSSRPHRFGPWNRLVVVTTRQGDVWDVTMAQSQGESIGSTGTPARAVLLFDVSLTGDVQAGVTEFPNTSGSRLYFDLSGYKEVHYLVSAPIVTSPNTAAFFLQLSPIDSDVGVELHELPMGSANNHGDAADLGWLSMGAGLNDASTVRTQHYNMIWPGYGAFYMNASGLLNLGANVWRVKAWGVPR